MNKEGEYHRKEQNNVTSNILGLVYTDLVCYILPGFLLLTGMFLILDTPQTVENLITGDDSLPSVVLVVSLPALAYMAGILISFLRWHLYDRIEDYFNITSFGRMAYGKNCGLVRWRINLEEPVLERTRTKIELDMKKLGWLKNSETLEPKEQTKEDFRKIIRLIDCFGNLMKASMRERGDRISLLIERWDDILVSQKCFILVLQILAIPWGVSKCGVGQWSCTIIIIMELGLLAIYFLLLPVSNYSHMRWILLSYLAGRLKVCELNEQEKRNSKKVKLRKGKLKIN